MKWSILFLLGLFALAILHGLAVAPNAEAGAASISIASAKSGTNDGHSHHRHSEQPGDSCATTAGQSCTPLIAQLRNWASTSLLPSGTPDLPSNDQHATRSASKPDTPPPRL